MSCNHRLMSARWYESERLERWSYTVGAILLILLGPGNISDVTSASRSGRDWVDLGIWAIATVGFVVFAVRHWRNRNKPVRSSLVGWIDPADVPVGDVQAAIAVTSNRIAAIKSLREQHSGLGLNDAADMVDTELGRSRNE
ncbi:hypothetical protein BDB13_6317 [Rhodococcus sp. OK302]|nr:hypothetical protein BDB13_6317 [Rhodococcus sp. OK302]